MLAGLSSAGPLVVLMAAPISSAMMYASVVLPRPGGPESMTWSSASPRWSAAVMKTRRLSLIFCCPMNSSSDWGRSAFSKSSSARAGWAETTERSFMVGAGLGAAACTTQSTSGGLTARVTGARRDGECAVRVCGISEGPVK